MAGTRTVGLETNSGCASWFDLAPSVAERELHLVTERRGCAALQRHEKKLGRVARPPRALNEQQVLPLEEARQPEIEAERVDGYVDARPGSEVVVGELRDQGIGVLDRELVEEAHVARRLDG